MALAAGLLTVAAPCVLPLLPVILGGSVNARAGERWRPFVIAGSLVASLVLFTLLLKASTVAIGIDPRVWTSISGGLLLFLGLTMLFPGAWSRVTAALRIDSGSHALLAGAHGRSNRMASAVLTGAALGPVFSSCSPMYAWVIATVLPASPALGMVYLGLYCVGVAIALLAIALLGRRLLARVGWAADPRGWFARTVAVVFILVGLSVLSGFDKAVQTKLVEADPIGIVRIEQLLLPGEAAGAAAVSTAPAVDPTVPRAAEFTGLTDWINSEPLTMADLRGKVVLVDFWTYSCVNCKNTQSHLNAWHDSFAADGLVIVGVHAPEFAFEKKPANVQQAVTEAGIAYPVALDNDFATWRAYDNRAWPTRYLIDQNGGVRFVHIGEGAYDETEAKIRELLAGSSAPSGATTPCPTPTAASASGTPSGTSTDGTCR